MDRNQNDVYIIIYKHQMPLEIVMFWVVLFIRESLLTRLGVFEG